MVGAQCRALVAALAAEQALAFGRTRSILLQDCRPCSPPAAMPWDQAARLLARLLDALAPGGGPPSALPTSELMGHAKAFYNETLGCSEEQWGQPTPRQRAALLQDVSSLGGRLAALDAPLQAALSDPAVPPLKPRTRHPGGCQCLGCASCFPGPALALMFGAAVATVGGSVVLAALGAPQREVLQLCQAFAVLLGSGTLQAASAAADLQRGRRAAPAAGEAERWAVVAAVVNIASRAMHHLFSLAATVAPPPSWPASWHRRPRP